MCSRFASPRDEVHLAFLILTNPVKRNGSPHDRILVPLLSTRPAWSKNSEVRAATSESGVQFDLTDVWLSSAAQCGGIEDRTPGSISHLSSTSKPCKANNHGDQDTPSNEPVSTSVVI